MEEVFTEDLTDFGNCVRVVKGQDVVFDMTGIKGSTQTNSKNYSKTSKNPTSTIGLNLVAGTDYYFAENFYAGLELGIAVNSKSIKAGEVVETMGSTTETSLSAPSREGSFGNNFISSFRLGWRF